MPSKLTALTWAFATGECGSETWDGVPGATVASANVQASVNAGKGYIISTGGAGGTFTCSTDAGFEKFISTYYSANMLGVDFDIENGQTQAELTSLITRVKNAEALYPNMRFSFTLATQGANAAQFASQNFAGMGVTVLNTIKSVGLTNYTIDLMVMDYGPPESSSLCTLGSNGSCDMAQSAIQAAISLNTAYAVPYSKIELTPMIGGNDDAQETFTLANTATLSAFVVQNGLAGVHFWSFDRDNDCAASQPANDTCNSYGEAGTLGFTNQFLTSLGL